MTFNRRSIAAFALAALVAGLIAAPSAGAAAAADGPGGSVVLNGPYTGCGAGQMSTTGDTLSVTGSFPADATVVSAIYRQFNAAESKVGIDRNVITYVKDETTGAFKAGSFTSNALNDAATHVRLLLTMENANGQTPFVSNLLTIDRKKPELLEFRTRSAKTVEVIFSEPVTNANGADAPIDWYLDKADPMPDDYATRVSGDGSSRLLTFDQANIGANAEPAIRYFPPPTRPNNYWDCVHRQMIPETGYVAKDGILPPIPVLASIAGSDATDRMTAGTASRPEVMIDGIETGGSGELWRETNGEPGLQTGEGGDSRIGSVPAGSNGSASVRSDELGTFEGAEYTFYVRALDANDNPSAGYDESVYRVDTAAPKFVSATTTDHTVVVTFDEAVYGPDGPAHWTITSPDIVGPSPYTVTNVEGSGSARTLMLSAVPRNAQVSYRAPEGERYRDDAGNLLPEFETVPTQPGAMPTSIDLEPETALVGVNDTHVLTATVNAGSGIVVPGALVTIRAISGPSRNKNADNDPTTPPGVIGVCRSEADGTCDVDDYSSSGRGVDVLQAWIGDTPPLVAEAPTGSSDATQDVVETEWTLEGTDLVLNADPEDATGPTNEPHSILVDVTMVGDEVAGLPVGDVNVDARVLDGPNAGKHAECVTDDQGKCPIVLRSTAIGTDEIQVWIDRDEDNTTDDELFCRRLADQTTCSGQDEAVDDSDPLFDDPAQDAVVKHWVGIGVTVLQVEPELSTGPSGARRSFTFLVTSTNSPAGVAGVNVDARVVSGPNAGRYLGECNTDPQGSCTVSYASSVAGNDSIQGWIDVSDDDIAFEASRFEARDETTGTDEADQDMIVATWTGAPNPAPSPTGSPDPTPSSSPSSSPTGSPSPDPSPSPTGSPDPTPSSSPNPDPSSSPSGDPSPTPTEPGSVGTRSASLTSSRSKVGFRRPVTFTGTLNGAEECLSGTVQLQRMRGTGPFTNLRTVEATDGSWATTLRPSKNATYRAVMTDTDACPRAASRDVPVLVKAKVFSRAEPATVTGSECLAIRGRVAPSKAGSRVQLQQFGSNGWIVVDSKKLTPRSTYRFVQCQVPNRYRFRVVWSGDVSNEPTSGPVLRGRVR